MRTYDVNLFRKASIDREWVQENHSYSRSKGTLRGLHFQYPPFDEAKLVRCMKGEIYDVFVDLRKGSVSFGKWDSTVLSAENKKMVLIPRGFAHGFVTLTAHCDVVYKVDNYYSPDQEAGLLWDDPDLNIDWPLEGKPKISEKDKLNMTFKEFIQHHSDKILYQENK